MAIRQDKTGYILNLSIHPDEVPEDLLRSPVGTRYAVAMGEYDSLMIEAHAVPEGALTVPTQGGKMMQNASSSASAEGRALMKASGILCKDERFQAWWGSFTEGATIASVKKAIGIDSRSELEHNREAQLKFLEIKGSYESYLLENPDADERN